MKVEKIKEMMDACYTARRIRDMLPELPEGVSPSYIRFMDVISKLKQQKGKVKVSDISNSLNIPRPGVTRTVKEMEARGYIRKVSSENDARVTFIEITSEGEALSEKFNRKYFSELSEFLDDISEEEANCMISTINKLYQIMYERKKQ